MNLRKNILRALVLLCVVGTVLTLASCGGSTTDPKENSVSNAVSETASVGEASENGTGGSSSTGDTSGSGNGGTGDVSGDDNGGSTGDTSGDTSGGSSGGEISTEPHVHTEVIALGKPATCTEPGFTDQTECSVCGEILVEQKMIPALGHTYENGKCIRCGKKDPSLISIGLEYELNSDGESYSVTGIGYCQDVDIVIPSTYAGKPVVYIVNEAFSYCTSLTSIEIPDSVTSIGFWAFNGCTSLTSIEIPNSVISIGRAAFYNCHELIQTENGIQYVDKWAIGCDEKIIQAVLRNDTVGIGERAFQDCKNLTSIEIPNSVIYIGECSFSNCTSLTSIEIPNSVTSIGTDAFCSCSSLTSIAYAGTKEQWNSIKKGNSWNSYTGNYVIHCTDGDITK